VSFALPVGKAIILLLWLASDIANIRTTINNLDNTEKVVHTTHTLGGGVQ